MGDNNENGPVSRRAFLRRAGAKAIATGERIVPGLAAANAAMKKAEKSMKNEDDGKITGRALADPNVVREEIAYPSGPDSIQATLMRPRDLSGTAPGVIVIHEIFGLTDHIRDVAARLALAGYVALAPDLYSHECGVPETTDFSVLREFVAKISDERVVADLQAGASFLRGRHEVGEEGKVGAVGFCMGGLYALLLAGQTPSLGASVVFYGRPIYRELTPQKPVSPLELMPGLAVPLQAHYGEADTGIPLADVEALRRAIPAGVPHEIHTYPDAPHAFHNDTREAYRPEPAKLAWQRTLDFLDRHLKG